MKIHIESKSLSYAIFVFLPVLTLIFTACDSGTSPVLPDINALTGTVSITGTAEAGQILTADTGSLGGDGDISYQWMRGNSASSVNTNINGAKENTYLLSMDDHAKFIAVKVTRQGYTGSIISNVKGPVIFYEGSGTEKDPFNVYNEATLRKVGSGKDGWTMSVYYRQIANIQIANPNINRWTPIGGETDPFTGVYDGSGFNISGIMISDLAAGNNQGMFGYVGENGIIKNIVLAAISISVSSSSNVGGIAGYLDAGMVLNCTVEGSGNITGLENTGGIAGYNNKGTITGCSSVKTVAARSGNGGGITGVNYYGIIENCHAAGDVSTYVGNPHIGGVAGYNDNGEINNCSAAGSIRGYQYTGGITGYNKKGIIAGCCFEGSVTGTDYTGGIAGYNEDSSLMNLYVTGNVTGSDYCGGLTGYQTAGDIAECYSTGNVTGIKYLGGMAGYLVSGALIDCYSTGKISGINPSGTGYTYLYIYIGGLAGYIEETCFITGCYSLGDIRGELYAGGIAGYINGGGTVIDSYSEGNIAASSDIASYPFLNRYNGYSGGIAGYIRGNVTITGCHSDGIITGANWTGGIAGYIEDSCIITGCYSTGRITDNSKAINTGGIVGYVQADGTIKNCYSAGEIYGASEIGGIAGHVEINCEITDCYSIGNIAGIPTSLDSDGNNIGGIIGYAGASAVIKRCYSMGDITGDRYLGGIAGYIKNGILEDCYSAGTIGTDIIPRATLDSGGIIGFFGIISGPEEDTEEGGLIKNCHSTGQVMGNQHVGGIAGRINDKNITVENCYSAATVKGLSMDAGGIAGSSNGIIKSCYTTGSVSAYSRSIGGIAGISYGIVENCYTTGNISGVDSGPQVQYGIGGVVGTNYNNTVKNCYAAGNISGPSCLGGIVGYNFCPTSIYFAAMTNCIALNSAVAINIPDIKSIGRATSGDRFNTIMSGLYSRSEMTVTILEDNVPVPAVLSTGTGEKDGEDITADEWEDETWWQTTAGFDFVHIWEMGTSGLPVLRNTGGDQEPVIKYSLIIE